MSTSTPAMATNTLPTSASPFSQMPAATKIKAGVGIVALGAVAVSAWLWSQQPDWKMLYSNLPDREGGAVIAQLVQMNVPYKYTDGGGAIMVPANMVNDTRLKLAAQGLPGNEITGYEILEKQRFGTTQFQERLNFQRGLEGELARSIQALSPVKLARVHLAMPVQTGFLREQQKPSASVMLTLYSGRTLDRGQVQGILHLVASSVPDMQPKQVSVVDQYGKLLSDLDGDGSEMNTAQINYRNQIESTLSRRISELLEPIVGDGNIRSQVAADIDFTQSEATAETYAPNQNPGSAAMRSQQMLASRDASGANEAVGGIPGSLSNQPPATVSAPINGSAQATRAAGSASASETPGGVNTKQESVTNYEVDRTVKFTKNQTGTIRRLSVAVLVNQKQTKGDDGKVISTPLSAMEIQSIEALVKQAVGFSSNRGDSVQVVNAAFTQHAETAEPETPLWKDPETISLAKDIGKQFGFVVLAIMIMIMLIRPAFQAIKKPAEGPGKKVSEKIDDPLELPLPAENSSTDAIKRIETAENQGMGMTIAQHNALQLARTDPTAVATVVRNWVNGINPDNPA
ncbi:MAG: flagellar basal-body MS-ring/collar protein FliF [Lautropia sp.]|nr:flagellar basal-body MS-ring/collar protein FliF [Lautropia sp.]